jgi:hypothetical protein
MINNIKSGAMIITVCAWPTLGFYRGLKSFDYNYSNDRIYKSSTRPLYINKVVWGLGGILCYLNPVGCAIGLYKEVYRLEVNLRGIEEEKKTAYYNEVL